MQHYCVTELFLISVYLPLPALHISCCLISDLSGPNCAKCDVLDCRLGLVDCLCDNRLIFNAHLLLLSVPVSFVSVDQYTEFGCLCCIDCICDMLKLALRFLGHQVCCVSE